MAWLTLSPSLKRAKANSPVFSVLRTLGTKPSACAEAALEAERHLQIDSAVVRTRAERPAGQRILLSENRRADYANRIPRVHVVENISRGDRKGQAVFLPGVVSP